MIKTISKEILENRSVKSNGTIESDKNSLNEIGEAYLDLLKEYLLLFSSMKKYKYIYLTKLDWNNFLNGKLALPMEYVVFDEDDYDNILGVVLPIPTYNDPFGQKQHIINEDLYFNNILQHRANKQSL